MRSTARLIVYRASMKTEYAAVTKLIHELRVLTMNRVAR